MVWEGANIVSNQCSITWLKLENFLSLITIGFSHKITPLHTSAILPYADPLVDVLNFTKLSNIDGQRSPGQLLQKQNKLQGESVFRTKMEPEAAQLLKKQVPRSRLCEAEVTEHNLLS